jgi:hypothetical protein
MKILRTKETIYGIGASGEWEKQFKPHIAAFMRGREKNKIKAKLLYTKGTQPILSSYNEVRFLRSNFEQPSSIAIFGEYVATFMWTTPLVASLVKSKQLSDSYKEYFKSLWRTASRK